MSHDQTGLLALIVAAVVLSTSTHAIIGRFSPWHRGKRIAVRGRRWHRLSRLLTAPLWLPWRILPAWLAIMVYLTGAVVAYLALTEGSPTAVGNR